MRIEGGTGAEEGREGGTGGLKSWGGQTKTEHLVYRICAPMPLKTVAGKGNASRLFGAFAQPIPSYLLSWTDGENTKPGTWDGPYSVKAAHGDPPEDVRPPLPAAAEAAASCPALSL